MKCKSIVCYEEKDGKTRVSARMPRSYRINHLDEELVPEAVECDGKVVSVLEIVDDGFEFPKLSISYFCNKCFNSTFPELPDTIDSLSLLLDKIINEMSETSRDAQIKLD